MARIDPLRAYALLKEKARRRRSLLELAAAGGDYTKFADGLMREQYPKQAACVMDPSPLVAVRGTRRSGKSRGWLRKMAYDAATTPNSYQLYINTTRQECRRIAWRGARTCDGLIGLNRLYRLGAKELKGEMTLNFPNNALIECVPADNIRAIERALGTAPHRVWIDEAQKMPHLTYAIREVLDPAMTDYEGQIVLTGVPSRDCADLFYEVTREDAEPSGWSVHALTVLDNPFFGPNREARYNRTIAPYLRKHNLTREDPEVRRMWYAEWPKEDANFVYHVHRVRDDELLYAPARWIAGQEPNREGLGGEPDITAALADLPKRADGSEYDWLFGLGTDLGYEPDPFAYVIWAWTWERPELFEVASWKQIRLISDAQAQIIKDLMARIQFGFMVGDAGGGGKSVVRGWAEGWQDRYPIPIDEAAKAHKATAIAFLNNDVRAGNVKLRRGGPLYAEMSKLNWAPKKGNTAQREDVRRRGSGAKQHPNDCCDAALYAHRESQHHRFREPEDEPEYGSPEYFAKIERELETAALERCEERDEHGFYQ